MSTLAKRTFAAVLPVAFATQLVGCDLLESVKSTVVVTGLVVKTPKISVAGLIDLDAEVVATSWVGERESATSKETPSPVPGAKASVVYAGVTLPLVEKDAGLFETTSVEEPTLQYESGASYAFVATLPEDGSTEYGGSVKAPTALEPAAVKFTPAPGAAHAQFPDARMHPKDTALTLDWPALTYGKHAFVSVVYADPLNVMNAKDPEFVYDSRPESASEIIEFVLGEPVQTLTIPAETFSKAGIYGVMLFVVDRGSPRTNTFLGSPFIAGSGIAALFAVAP